MVRLDKWHIMYYLPFIVVLMVFQSGLTPWFTELARQFHESIKLGQVVSHSAEGFSALDGSTVLPYLIGSYVSVLGFEFFRVFFVFTIGANALMSAQLFLNLGGSKRLLFLVWPVSFGTMLVTGDLIFSISMIFFFSLLLALTGDVVKRALGAFLFSGLLFLSNDLLFYIAVVLMVVAVILQFQRVGWRNVRAQYRLNELIILGTVLFWLLCVTAYLLFFMSKNSVGDSVFSVVENVHLVATFLNVLYMPPEFDNYRLLAPFILLIAPFLFGFRLSLVKCLWIVPLILALIFMVLGRFSLDLRMLALLWSAVFFLYGLALEFKIEAKRSDAWGLAFVGLVLLAFSLMFLKKSIEFDRLISTLKPAVVLESEQRVFYHAEAKKFNGLFDELYSVGFYLVEPDVNFVPVNYLSEGVPYQYDKPHYVVLNPNNDILMDNGYDVKFSLFFEQDTGDVKIQLFHSAPPKILQ